MWKLPLFTPWRHNGGSTVIAPCINLWEHPTSLPTAPFRAQINTHMSWLGSRFQGLVKHQPQVIPTNPRAAYSDQSQSSLYWPISQHTDLADRIKGDRLELNSVKPPAGIPPYSSIAKGDSACRTGNGTLAGLKGNQILFWSSATAYLNASVALRSSAILVCTTPAQHNAEAGRASLY
jgi:hypothetical protein